MLVTGSGSGMTGKATARLFLEEGARVLIHALSEAEVQSCLDDLSKFDKVLGKSGDLKNPKEVHSLFEFASRHDEIDILINNVGIFSVKTFMELTDDDWINYFDTNVQERYALVALFCPRCLQEGRVP